jgi:hypothetical protein
MIGNTSIFENSLEKKKQNYLRYYKLALKPRYIKEHLILKN